MRFAPIIIAAALCAAAAAAAPSQPSRFDGAWSVTMTCPPHNGADDDAKGYTHRFAAQVQDGRLRGTHGTQGEPGWHFLHGRINDDGSATLRLEGIVNNADYAINNAARGKPYSYRIKALFEGDSGSGQRITGRVCDFAFAR